MEEANRDRLKAREFHRRNNNFRHVLPTSRANNFMAGLSPKRWHHFNRDHPLALLPRQAVVTPAPPAATLLLFVWVTFKTFQNVVSFQPQFGGTLGGSNRAHTTATQQNHFFIGRCGQ